MLPVPDRYTHLDGETAELTNRLIALAMRGLPRMYRADSDEFAFTRTFTAAGGLGATPLSGSSLRYAAIVALGAFWLADAALSASLIGKPTSLMMAAPSAGGGEAAGH